MSNTSTPRVIFMGPLYPVAQEGEILQKAKAKPSSAPNVFQWNLIRGMEEALGQELEIINALPVGTWPNAYAQAVLPDRQWMNGKAICRETGCVNLPVIKQAMRARKALKALRKTVKSGDSVVLYSAYLPYLKALAKLPKDVQVTAIITDLPEYYDLGTTSSVRRVLRAMQNRMVYRCFERVDCFVLLTEQMHEALKVGSRPWLLMEGICTAEAQKQATETRRAIFYSGTLHYQFGIRNLLQAFEQMDDPDAKLWICGGGEAEGEIRELCARDTRVTFYGFLSQQEVAQLRAKAAVLVNPRTNEGEYTKYSFPSKTMEYMASGKPVVMYRLDGIPQEYDPYLYYVADDTPATLAQTLAYVLAHPEEANEKAAQAQRFVLENKNRKAQGERLLHFLRS